MNQSYFPDKISLIAINDILILNPRERKKPNFQKVIESIASVGLKRPIKVSTTSDDTKQTEKPYKLICGQGRLEAFIALGETHIPAFVVSLSDEECFLQSLIENLARRRHSAFELMKGVESLVERGYSVGEIAKKTGLNRKYVSSIIRLMEDGEERLIAAVEQNKIPISVAMEISTTSHAEAQIALQEAYENDELRGHKLQTAIRVINTRRKYGPGVNGATKKYPSNRNSSASMVRAYKKETERQRVLIQRADSTENRLLIVKSALEVLLRDDNFKTLLRAESLDTIPTQIAEMLELETQTT